MYGGLTDHRSTVIPTFRRSAEGHIHVIIGLEFYYPYRTSTTTIHQALTSRLDVDGVISVNGGDGAYVFDVLSYSIGEECE